MTTGAEPTLTTDGRSGRVKRARDGNYRYSKEIAGDKGNYGWPVTFDVTQTYVGINQQDESGRITDRVLLTAAQYKALVAFVERGEGRK
jgi:hypothetical protein